MHLPKLYSHHATEINRPAGDTEAETVIGLTTNPEKESEVGDLFALIPEAENGQEIADEIVRRCNTYDKFKDIIDMLAGVQMFNAAEEEGGTEEDGTEQWEIPRPSDGEADSHETLMNLVRMARAAKEGV